MGGRQPDSRQQEIAEISRSLKMLAKELEIPVIAISQLNRNPKRAATSAPSCPIFVNQGRSNRTQTS